MGETSDLLQSLFRWLHIFFGILWIGHLYFFNFVNAPFAATMDGATKQKVVPELMPRALFWFRYGALWTWITGVLLLALVFYHSGLAFSDGFSWSAAAAVMITVTFTAPFIYDAIFKAMDHTKVSIAIGFVLIGVIAFLMDQWAHFGHRGLNIHVASMFGTIMAFNVWFRIWPAQQKIIRAIKDGQAPDAAWVKLAGMRSKHNTYLSLPLIWGMMNAHTTFFAGGNWGLTDHSGWAVYLAVILLSWHVIWHMYKKSTKVSGF